jgi:aconitate hydratase
MKAASMFRDFNNSAQDPVFTQIYELDLSTVVPSLSGPKRPQDRIAQSDFKLDFSQCLSSKVGVVQFLFSLQKCVKGFVIIYIRLVSKDSVLRKKS